MTCILIGMLSALVTLIVCVIGAMWYCGAFTSFQAHDTQDIIDVTRGY